jgi:hypothetical protein
MLKLMFEFARGNHGESFLGVSMGELVDAAEDLLVVVFNEELFHWGADEFLDIAHGLCVKAVEGVFDELLDRFVELFGGLIIARLEELVDKAALVQLVGADGLASQQGLVCLGESESLDERVAGSALRDQAEVRERGQQVRIVQGVDEVSMGNQRSRETNGRPVHGNNQNLGMAHEGLGERGVAGAEGGEPVFLLFKEGFLVSRIVRNVRSLGSALDVGSGREELAGGLNQRGHSVPFLGSLLNQPIQQEVAIQVQRIVVLGAVQCDDRSLVFHLVLDQLSHFLRYAGTVGPISII